MVIQQTKTCNRCRKTKPMTDFHKHKGFRDGLRNICKECRKKSERDPAEGSR